MNEERRNSAAEEGSPNHGHPEAAFGQELLSCYVCEKIYFTRRPIRLRTSRGRSYYVCLDCSRTLTCSTCSRPVAAGAGTVVEKPPDFPAGLLCPACRDKVFFGLRPQPDSLRGRLRSAVASVRDAALRLFRRIARLRIGSSKKSR